MAQELKIGARDPSDLRSSCLACGSSRRHVLDRVRDVERAANPSLPTHFDIWLCDDCGLGHLAEELSPEQLSILYPDSYYSYAQQGRSFRSKMSVWLEGIRYKRYRHIPKFTSLLEIGCGSGAFLASIKDRGRVVGIERSAAAHKAAVGRGLDVRIGNIEDDVLFRDGEFDCVYLNHSLEHLSNPDRAMASIRRILAPQGVLYIGVPNIAGLTSRLMGRSWYGLTVPEHVTQWTPKAMRVFLKRFGFSTESVRFHSDPLSLPLSAFYALGGRRTSVSGFHPAKIVILLLSYLLLPITRILDIFGLGDLMEVTAKRDPDRLP